jgi:hypothetical protein
MMKMKMNQEWWQKRRRENKKQADFLKSACFI